ncbi:auxin-responsive protein IAA4 [Citrus sinensis]|uniref:Auxin-responsive protein IAA4 n=1 Tax=Citrus sinensis TaxID=2711 RepID=A0ACB8MIU6_CITSI|nr:auxin-responsive protein IAA4 [Citrus sinensis]
MERLLSFESDHLKATELRLGLPGSDKPSVRANNNKRASSEISQESKSNSCAFNAGDDDERDSAPPAKAQVVGWPPIRSYRKNTLQVQAKTSESELCRGMYVKVSMDGAPYLRKIDLKVYTCYPELLNALENMFQLTIGKYSEREGYNGSDYAPTYEDKDGDWMLVGDVPWE